MTFLIWYALIGLLIAYLGTQIHDDITTKGKEFTIIFAIVTVFLWLPALVYTIMTPDKNDGF